MRIEFDINADSDLDDSFIFAAPSGLGVIGGDTNNFVGLGGCKPDHYLANLPGYCDSRVMRNPTMWLGIFTGG